MMDLARQETAQHGEPHRARGGGRDRGFFFFFFFFFFYGD